jgi:hypothetical protein
MKHFFLEVDIEVIVLSNRNIFFWKWILKLLFYPTVGFGTSRTCSSLKL